MFCKIFLGVPGSGRRAILSLFGAPMILCTVNAKIFQNLGPKKRKSCDGDQVYDEHEKMKRM